MMWSRCISSYGNKWKACLTFSRLTTACSAASQMRGCHPGDDNIWISLQSSLSKTAFPSKEVQLQSLQFGHCVVPLIIFRALRNTSVIWKLWKCFYKLPSSLPTAWRAFPSGLCALSLLKTLNKSSEPLHEMIDLCIRIIKNPPALLETGFSRSESWCIAAHEYGPRWLRSMRPLSLIEVALCGRPHKLPPLLWEAIFIIYWDASYGINIKCLECPHMYLFLNFLALYCFVQPVCTKKEWKYQDLA